MVVCEKKEVRIIVSRFPFSFSYQICHVDAEDKSGVHASQAQVRVSKISENDQYSWCTFNLIFFREAAKK